MLQNIRTNDESGNLRTKKGMIEKEDNKERKREEKKTNTLFKSRRKSLYTSGYLRKSSGIFGDLRMSFENFGNRRKPSVNPQKFSFCGEETSHAFY